MDLPCGNMPLGKEGGYSMEPDILSHNRVKARTWHDYKCSYGKRILPSPNECVQGMSYPEAISV
jgi:hypothetical protein